MALHLKCRNGAYPFTQIFRLSLIDCMIPWTYSWPDYSPPNYTSPQINGKPWADPDLTDPKFQPQWNQLDGAVNRASYNGTYKVVNGVPLNIVGRTGLCGRGVLGRWGPNHAADPIVTRWKRKSNGELVTHPASKKPILQFCAIRRRDNQEWAIPGGMVDPNEQASQTLLREFQEEALNNYDSPNQGTEGIGNSKLINEVLIDIEKSKCEAFGQISYQWFVPSGMVAIRNRLVSDDLLESFEKEAMAYVKHPTKRDVKAARKLVEDFFAVGNLVYQGYVDDPRNTDNAWMETIAQHFHDKTGHLVGKFPFYAGDDATKVRWMDIDSNLNLYASHSQFIKIVCSNLEAHWDVQKPLEERFTSMSSYL